MHMAIQSSNSQRPANIIKRLMIKGADMKITDKKGRNALDLCKKKFEKNRDLEGTL